VKGKCEAYSAFTSETDRNMILKLQNGTDSQSHIKENKLNPQNLNPQDPIQAILDALASQQRQGETSLIVRLEPDLIPAVVDALRDYRKMFAPVIPGVTDKSPIYAAYQRMRQAEEAKHTILLLVECQTTQEFRDAIGRMPIRHSSEWRSFPTAGPVSL
jgi:hypothetical protein